MRWVLLILVGVAGCPGPAPGDDEPTPDAPPAGDTALRLEWRALPSMIPGPAGDGIAIERIRLDVKNLQVVGDIATARTDQLELDWEMDMGPGRIDFNNVMVGLYSVVEMELSGFSDEEDGVDIRGTCMIDGDPEDFEVEDIGPIAVSLPVAIVIQPGDDLTQVIEIDFARALGEIDFASLPRNDGRRVLDETSPQLETFRSAVEAAFVAPDVPTTTPN